MSLLRAWTSSCTAIGIGPSPSYRLWGLPCRSAGSLPTSSLRVGEHRPISTCVEHHSSHTAATAPLPTLDLQFIVACTAPRPCLSPARGRPPEATSLHRYSHYKHVIITRAALISKTRPVHLPRQYQPPGCASSINTPSMGAYSQHHNTSGRSLRYCLPFHPFHHVILPSC